ncbi:MAG: DUF4878 domain-containing protein [Sphingobacteriales bacterium]|nr:MAG: DUF4878 domain-containing protein [Sphingobacteriales bacterium]
MVKKSMKKMLLCLVLTLAGTLTLTGCDSDSPKATAEKFLTALYHYDFETAKEVSTDETKKMIETIAQFSNGITDSMRMDAKKLKVKILDTKVNGDTAVVKYETTEDPGEKSVTLVQQEHKWMVLPRCYPRYHSSAAHASTRRRHGGR